jgi:hypothetical protein
MSSTKKLDRDVRDAEQRARGSTEEHALGRRRDAAMGRCGGHRNSSDQHAALHRDQRCHGVGVRLALGAGGDADDRKARRGDDHPDPLTASQPQAEEALREHGKEHQAA